ncbi:MAG: 30S ribosome-binding factor RbfA [endosymbiont of Galathealinum brachiosum]|uniref:Ribosome-binding factor A n=1 Tax=endosymbiont of Galathealinum brachiosum TaxID=2200906 RepID=A0A370DA58_9GAMM|nr:MAG: 30S ribosome-binding factor RbfA [endosymbiont of Galathealinum brachiosum]
MMPKEYSRSQRMAEQVRRELAELVRDEIKDPRVNWVSFTAVKVTRDLSSAVVYFTVLNEDEREQAEEGLNKATGFIRRELGKRIRSRIVPSLRFVYDVSIERGTSMESLIAQARSSDADSSED